MDSFFGCLREPLRSGMALNLLRNELREADGSSAAGGFLRVNPDGGKYSFLLLESYLWIRRIFRVRPDGGTYSAAGWCCFFVIFVSLRADSVTDTEIWLVD